MCPCNVIAGSDDDSDDDDNADDCKAEEVIPVSVSTDSVTMVFPPGRFGNHLFAYSAAIVTNREDNLALIMGNDWPTKRLPRLPELAFKNMVVVSSDTTRNNVTQRHIGIGSYEPGSPYYQRRAWVQKFFLHRRAICHYLSMPSVLGKTDRPGPNDIVVQIRRLSGSLWEEVFNVNKETGHKSLPIPPLIYYERILEQGNYENVWLVVDPCIRPHPIVQQLVRRFGAKFHEGNAEQDFQFISYASTVIVSPSTFAWFSTFLGSTSRHKTIHYPIMPMDVPMPWCELLMQWSSASSSSSSSSINDVHKDGEHPVTLYHDWYRNTTFVDDDGTKNTTKSAVILAAVKEVCRQYKQNLVAVDEITPFYKELVGETGGRDCRAR